MHLGNLTLTKMQPNLQKSHVYASELFLYTWVEERIIFHWSHMVILFFRIHGAGHMRTCVSNSPIKKYEAKNLQPKIVLRKECREKIFTNTFDSGTFEGLFEENIAEG